MDPVSAAASIAGLIALTGSVIQVSHQFVSGVRHAKDDAQSLIDELNTLAGLLHKLETIFVARPKDAPTLDDSSVLQCSSRVLGARFEAVRQKLESTSQSRIRSLIWPIEKKDHLETIAQTRAFGQLIHFALSVDTWSLLSSTSGETATILAKQIDGLQALDTIGQRIDTLEQAVKGQTLVLQERHLDEDRQKVLDWLANDVQGKLHERITSNRVTGTGQWLLGHPDFQQWTDLKSSANVLWCPGVMGSGKTNLCSRVIDHLREETFQSKNDVAFFYFSHADAPTQTIGSVVGSLIRQLLQNPDRPISPTFSQLSKKHESIEGLSTDELYTILVQCIDEHDGVYLLFDAVDETDTIKTLQPLLNLVTKLKEVSKLRICATGRDHNHEIRVTFDTGLTIPIKADDSDLRIFIQSKMDSANSSELLQDDELRAEISQQLMSSAHGLFLLPALQLNRVLQEPTRGYMEDALQQLPGSLVGVLDQNIDRILNQSASRRTTGMNALMWLCNVQRPLHRDELSDVLSLDLLHKRDLHKKYRPSAKVIVECCQGLIYLDEASQTIHLVHLAVREHIITYELRLYGEPTSKIIARACFLYLLDPAFDHGPRESANHPPNESSVENEILGFLNDHPVFHYLSSNCGWHARDYLADPEVRSLLMQFLLSPARTARSVQVGRYVSNYRYRYWSLEHVWSVSGLHLACEFGLTEVACELIDTGKADVDSETSIGGTALITAASSNQLDTLRALLQRGADAYKANWYGNALHCAAERNCLDTLRELLALHVNPNTLSPTRRTALSCTTDRECVEAAEILLQNGASMYYGVIASTSKRSFFGEIAALGSVNMLNMIVQGGYVSGEDTAIATRTIEAMIGKGLSLEEARQLTQRLEYCQAGAQVDRDE